MSECIVLALDPSKSRSGAAILTGQRSAHLFGPAKKQSARESFVRAAVELANTRGLPVLIVAEEWDKPRHKRVRNARGDETVEFDQKWTFQTILGMGEGWGRWAAELERYDIRSITRVTPNRWRDDLFGKRRGKDTKSAKKMALLFAENHFALSLQEDDDTAEALCLGVWFRTFCPEFLGRVADERARIERAMKRRTKASSLEKHHG